MNLVLCLHYYLSCSSIDIYFFYNVSRIEKTENYKKKQKKAIETIITKKDLFKIREGNTF
jgi:hypothetical protein